MHMHMRARMHVHVHVCMCICTFARAYAHAHAYICMCTCKHMHAHMWICTCTRVHVHVRTGVLCKANEAGMTADEAVEAVFTTRTAKIGVQAQVFTVVDDDAYDYPSWDILNGWNTDLATDVAIYQASAYVAVHSNLWPLRKSDHSFFHAAARSSLVGARTVTRAFVSSCGCGVRPSRSP